MVFYTCHHVLIRGYPSNGEIHLKHSILILLFYLWSIRKSTRSISLSVFISQLVTLTETHVLVISFGLISNDRLKKVSGR